MYKNIIAVVFLISSVLAQSQSTDHREFIYIHTSGHTVISGETLYFSLYVVSEESGQLIDLSKIVYVQLIGEQGAVIKQKIEVIGGRGQGSIFLSSAVPTGNYHLVANTRWMKNFNDYLIKPIQVINPFDEYNPEKSSITEWSVHFDLNFGRLMAGVTNYMSMKVTNPAGEMVSPKAILIGNNNEKIKNIVANSENQYTFHFKPKPDIRYQVLLEDENQQFHFFDLPEVESEPYKLQVEDEMEKYNIQAATSLEELVLTVSTLQNQLYEWPISASFNFSLKKNMLAKGFLFFELKDLKGQVLTQTTFFNQTETLTVEKSNQAYPLRSKVNERFDIPEGSYSVSVRKKWDTFEEKAKTAVRAKFDFFLAQKEVQSEEVVIDRRVAPKSFKSDTFEYLPEHFNELLAGTVSGLDTRTKELTLTMLEGSGYFAATKINDQGQFLFHYESPYESETVVLKPLGDSENNLAWTIENKFADYELPPFKPVVLDSIQRAEVIAYSINNQIEKAYEQVIDAEMTQKLNTQFELFDFFYRLDDYTRFPKFNEYFTEYMLGASVRNGKIKIAQKDKGAYFDDEPLILLDGLPVDSKTLLNINPYHIESVGIINTRVYHQSLIRNGLLFVKSYEGNLAGLSPNEFGHSLNVLGLSKPATFKIINHSELTQREPDKRSLLYWSPITIVNETQNLDLSFFTSDVTGTYEIVIEGFSEKGEAISIHRIFSVVE